MTKTFNTTEGKLTVRNAMIEDDNGTDLHDGIEIKDESGNITEVFGWYDIDELTEDDVEKLFENN